MFSYNSHNPTICKTKYAYDSYWYCLANMTSGCVHRFAYGEHRYCLHNDRSEFSDVFANCLNGAEPL